MNRLQMNFLIFLVFIINVPNFGGSAELPDMSEFLDERFECIKVGDFKDMCIECTCYKLGENPKFAMAKCGKHLNLSRSKFINFRRSKLKIYFKRRLEGPCLMLQSRSTKIFPIFFFST